MDQNVDGSKSFWSSPIRYQMTLGMRDLRNLFGQANEEEAAVGGAYSQ